MSATQNLDVIFRALDPHNADEGLAVALDHGARQLVVQIACEGRTRTVWLMPDDALRMAMAIAVSLRPDGVQAFMDSMGAATPGAPEAT